MLDCQNAHLFQHGTKYLAERPYADGLVSEFLPDDETDILTGRVRIYGRNWTAVLKSVQLIPPVPGATVTVESVDGLTLTVVA